MVADDYTSSVRSIVSACGRCPLRPRNLRFSVLTQDARKARLRKPRGPPFRKAGRIPLYPKSGLDDWAQSKIGPLVRSTSESSVHREKDIGTSRPVGPKT